MGYKYYLSSLETSNFHFVGVAVSKDGAMNHMEVAWRDHQRNTGSTLSWREIKQDVNIHEIELGDVINV